MARSHLLLLSCTPPPLSTSAMPSSPPHASPDPPPPRPISSPPPHPHLQIPHRHAPRRASSSPLPFPSTVAAPGPTPTSGAPDPLLYLGQRLASLDAAGSVLRVDANTSRLDFFASRSQAANLVHLVSFVELCPVCPEASHDLGGLGPLVLCIKVTGAACGGRSGVRHAAGAAMGRLRRYGLTATGSPACGLW